MRIELIIALNVGGWLLVQLGLAWAFTKMPAAWFKAGPPLAWERGGRFYERVFGIKRWKDWLPDGARWFSGGFAKGQLTGKGTDYWQQFIRETWRGELCHWCALACAPVFFLWNPWWGNLIIVTYAVTANLPCILALRYNRSRLFCVLSRHRRKDL